MAAPNPRAGTALDAQPLMQLSFSHAPSHILTTSLQLGVFSHIAAGRHTVAEVARAAQASERGTRMLLDALAGLELLSKSDGRYELAPMTEQFLVRGRPDYIGEIMETGRFNASWANLTEAVRTGKPDFRVEQQQTAEEYFPLLVKTLHVVNRVPARRLAEALGAGTERRGIEVLDIACGSGVWGIAIAEADPQARVTAQDYPGVLEGTTRQYLRRHGVEDRFDFLPGNLQQVEFAERRYDAALLGNIVHSEGEQSSRDLFARLRRALKPGGAIAIVDMIPNDQRSGPPFPLIFAINMLLHTSEGDCYTLAEYTRWLHEAGFLDVRTADLGSHSPAIIAR